MKEHNLVDESTERIHATGGGAYKYSKQFDEHFGHLNLKILKHDEMESMVNGMAFVLQHAKEHSFTFSEKFGKKVNDQRDIDFPKLLVSVGSGVSMIKVNNYSSYERVSGTMIGGGTLLGLANLLTGVNNFDNILELSKKGDNSKVDMLVKDIYGDNSPLKGLSGDLLASSFTKVAYDHDIENRSTEKSYGKEDVLNSLVFMISFNIG